MKSKEILGGGCRRGPEAKPGVSSLEKKWYISVQPSSFADKSNLAVGSEHGFQNLSINSRGRMCWGGSNCYCVAEQKTIFKTHVHQESFIFMCRLKVAARKYDADRSEGRSWSARGLWRRGAADSVWKSFRGGHVCVFTRSQILQIRCNLV